MEQVSLTDLHLVHAAFFSVVSVIGTIRILYEKIRVLKLCIEQTHFYSVMSLNLNNVRFPEKQTVARSIKCTL